MQNNSKDKLIYSKDSGGHNINRNQHRASSGQPTNSLIDEKMLKSKKARMNKDAELKKHIISVHNLKRKLAKQIVNKTANIEEFKEMTLNDLF